MRKKYSINLARLTTRGIGAYADMLIDVVQQNENQEIKAHHTVINLQQVLEEYLEALEKKHGAKMGKEVAALDVARGKVYQSLKNLVQSRIIFGGEKGAAAKELYQHFKKFKYIGKYNSYERQMVIDRIIRDLSSPESMAMLTLLALTDELESLQKAQAEYSRVRSIQQDTESFLHSKRSAYDLKPKLIVAIRDFLSYVWLMADQPGWDDLYHDVRVATQSAKRGSN